MPVFQPDELFASGHARELLQQQAARAAAAKAKLADELLVSGAMAGRALDPPYQLTICPGIGGLGHLEIKDIGQVASLRFDAGISSSGERLNADRRG